MSREKLKMLLAERYHLTTTTWKLHSLVMGLYEKHGGSKHEDIVSYCETQLTLFDLPYSNAVAVVTDTKATMVAAGCLFVWNSVAANGNTKCLGCIDHLLQLVTKKAFSGNVYCSSIFLFFYFTSDSNTLFFP